MDGGDQPPPPVGGGKSGLCQCDSGAQVKWQLLMNMLAKFQVDVFNSRTSAALSSRRRVLYTSHAGGLCFEERKNIRKIGVVGGGQEHFNSI